MCDVKDELVVTKVLRQILLKADVSWNSNGLLCAACLKCFGRFPAFGLPFTVVCRSVSVRTRLGSPGSGGRGVVGDGAHEVPGRRCSER